MKSNKISPFVSFAYDVHGKILQSVWDSCDNISRRKDTPALYLLKEFSLTTINKTKRKT